MTESLLDLVGAFGLTEWLTSLLQHEVTKMTIAFMIAARLHRKWVKKDMAEQFSKITASIDKLSDRLAEDLGSHSKRIDDLSLRVQNVETRLSQK